MNYSDTTADGTGEYDLCYAIKEANKTNCYFALDGQLKDINNNTSTFTVSDSDKWIYAFNRNEPPLDSIEPIEITRFVTDPLEIIGYGIRVDGPTGANRAWGFDSTSTDNNGSAVRGVSAVIAQSTDKPYIGASEAENSGGKIYFVIEPGAEDFAMDNTAPDVNLTFSIADAQDADYVATYHNSDGEYITFEFAVSEFKQDYNSTIILHSVSQNAGMTYSDSDTPGSVYVLADTSFYPSADLDATYPVENQQFDTGLLLDMQKPELLSVIAYREPVAGDGNFSIPIDTTVDSNPYFGRGDQVVFRFSFSENLGSVENTASNAFINLGLDLDSYPITITASPPTPDVRSTSDDDFDTFDITYTVEDDHAGSINNASFFLDAKVSDINGNTITGEDLNISRTISGFISPLVSGDYPRLSAVNIYRRVNLSSADSEVYSPIPDLANGISEYTLIGGETLYIAATFSYTLDALEEVYPDFQEYDHDDNPDTDPTIESNYSFLNQISSTSFIAEYNASFSDSNLSVDGANVLLFRYDINASNDLADSGDNTLLLEGLTGLGDVSKIYDIYGNPTSDVITSAVNQTVTRIDSTAPTLIGVRHAVAAGQALSKLNYGPLDSNISFALTFDEVIDINESFKTLKLNFYIGDSRTGTTSYSARTLRQGTTIALLEEADSTSVYEAGQIVNMIYFLNSNDYGTIDVNASDINTGGNDTFPMFISGEIYDYHNGTKGNKATLSAEVNNSSDSNSDIYIPVLTIDQTAIEPARWAIEASNTANPTSAFTPHGSNHPAGLVWESNASVSGSNSNITARVGIGNTISFIVDYDKTNISVNSLYLDSDTTGGSPQSLISGDNNVSLLFTSRSYDLKFYAPISNVVYDQSSNTSSLIFTYGILETLDLELDALSFESIIIPDAHTIRSSAYNEIIITGADFDQSTSAMIDAIYPQIDSIDVYAPNDVVFSDSTGRRYFGENDDITFRVTFTEQLIDTNFTDSDPHFALSWTMLDDTDSSTMYYFDSSKTSIGIAKTDVNHSSGSITYNLVFPVELETNTALTENAYQGLIQFSASSPTKVFTDATGVIADLAQNSLLSFDYSVEADLNASNNFNYAVDFIRPRLQYIESHSSASNYSYTYYDGIGGEALTHYYGAVNLSFYVVHDASLDHTSSNLPELALSVPTLASADDAEFNLSLYNRTTWPTSTDGSQINQNALAFVFDISAASNSLSNDTFEGVVSFDQILRATSYFDEPGNYAYFQLNSTSNEEFVYNADGNLSLGSGGYVPSVNGQQTQAYPKPTIYIDTTPPIFTIDNNQTIELTNRALVFNLNLDRPLSDLERLDLFNNNADAIYNSAPTYTISWQNKDGGLDSYSGLLYDGLTSGTVSGSDVVPFSFTLFSDAGTPRLTSNGQPDTDANYATYLDDLADNTDHNFTITVTDFVGNSHTESFIVHKTTDEFIGYLTGWNDTIAQPTEYDTITDDGKISLADAATSATFAVSFITAIDDDTLNPDDFNITYSSGPDDDIAELSIEQSDIEINPSTSTTDDGYLITVKGGNLPLAAGTFTLAFAADQDITTADGATLFDLSLIHESNRSFSYSKDFSFGIDSVTQPNHGTEGAIPDLEVNFTAPATGSDPAVAITGYKLYYTLNASSDPTTSSPYFSTSTHPNSFTLKTASAQSFAHSCLPILGATSQGYSFRVVAEYTIGGSGAYETHINRGITEGIELNTTLPTYTASTTSLALPTCERATFVATDADIYDNFGRGLALSRDPANDPLRNFVASGQYRANNSIANGAIRHYARAGAEFVLSSDSAGALELIDNQASEFGHNLAFPTGSINNYDLFIAGDPFYTTAEEEVNTGLVQLYHKASTSDVWTATTIDSGTEAAAAGAAVAIAVNTGNAFALYGEPRYITDSANPSSATGRIVLMKFNAGTWSEGVVLTLGDFGAVAGDSLFGSAIAVTEGGEAIAVMSSKAVYIFSLKQTGALDYLHSIAASDFLGANGSLLSDSVNSGQALALQKTELNNSYLLAIGLPHDSSSSSGIIYGAEPNNADTIGNSNYGGVLLLTTSTSTSTSLSLNSTWRQLAYLRSDSPLTTGGFYGSNLQLVNPEQPMLMVSEPLLAYGYNTGVKEITTNDTASGTAQLHIYYLNTDGADATDQEHLIFSPDSSTFSGGENGYAYAFDYANNSLAISSPSDDEGKVSLHNLFTTLDLSGSGVTATPP